MKSIARVRYNDEINVWVVEIYSLSANKWIIQGEHSTAEAANKDLASW